jgi:hypothetical protein
MFLRSGWSIVRIASLAKGGTSKKRLSLYLRKVPTWSNKVSSQTFQMALVYIVSYSEFRTEAEYKDS